MLEIEGVGCFAREIGDDWSSFREIQVPFLGQACHFVLVGYQTDSAPEDFHSALRNFLALDRSVLEAVEDDVYRYYRDMNDGCWEESDPEYVRIDSPSEVWRFVELGDEPYVERRAYGDKKIYISLGCGCEWEPEHGLLIVFKEGLRVNKIGAQDGHVTNSDAYADDSLEDVVYR